MSYQFVHELKPLTSALLLVVNPGVHLILIWHRAVRSAGESAAIWAVMLPDRGGNKWVVVLGKTISTLSLRMWGPVDHRIIDSMLTPAQLYLRGVWHMCASSSSFPWLILICPCFGNNKLPHMSSSRAKKNKKKSQCVCAAPTHHTLFWSVFL